MMMAARNDIKDRLIHNQSPYPTKDKVLSYTIPLDHSESLLFCSGANSQDNGSLNFITSEDDPCNGRDSLASFLDEGLGTSLDGVDEISSPIFPTLGRNDSGVFSSDEGIIGPGIGVGATLSTHNHTSLIPPPISSSTSTCSSTSSGSGLGSSKNNIISVAEVVNWKGCTNSGTPPNSILLSPATATISVVTDSVTGIPSIICSSTNAGNNGATNGTIPTVKLEARIVNQISNTGPTGTPVSTGKGNVQQSAQRCKSMPLGRQGPQKCTICDKVFSNASALTKHKLTHSDERRHACTTCGKAFKRQDHLNGHMLTHRNKKPFECKSKGCGKSYCDARSLRRHVENRHGHEVLESMNLTGHKHKNNNHNQNHESPQPELAPAATVTFTAIKTEPKESCGQISPKTLDCMPVLQPEQPQPQLQLETSSPDKLVSVQNVPPLLHKVGDGHPISTVPIVLKRENVSVFDFDENVEDAPVSFSQDKLISSLSNATIKVSNVIDSSKLGPLPDIRLIQEWTKRLGDSKVAFFLASSSTASSIAQLTGPMTSIHLDGQTSVTTVPGASHAFIPTSENGVFSVTPISLLPTSSGEFTFKPATISVPSSESPKPLYIVPSEPLMSTLPPTISVATAPSSTLASMPSLNITSNITTASTNILSVPKQSQPSQKIVKEEKTKNDKGKAGIGSSLANRIKTKLKAGSLKKLGKSNSSDSKSDKQSASIVIGKHVGDDTGTKSVLMTSQQLPVSQLGMPTIAITAGGGIATWCDSPKDCLLNAMEEDRLSEGAEGDDKPVECSICCRRFKNTPALNGHMRLHGGYFKKETEGSKKKEQVSKESTNTTPLQTASVSVRALIEEKIKERRNNLLKLAAASEKAASEAGTPTESSGQAPSTSAVPSNETSKLDKNVDKPKLSVATLGNSETKSSTSPATIAQQPKLLLLENNTKLKLEPNSEKDRNCDPDTNLSNGSTSNAPSAPPIIDSHFHDLSVLIGSSEIGVGGMGTNDANDLLPPLLRDSMQSTNSFCMDKSNFTLLDCGINADDLCQAFHLIYVDNNGVDMPLTMDQETLGKVSKMFQDQVPEMPSLIDMNGNQNMKGSVELMGCAPHDDTCNLPWEWRNSTSSDNTDSLSNVQDCVSSLLCSSSSENMDDSIKDPIASGGFCYTPILSPNSTFCLTPGPDSPFEAPSHSLSFICPSPSIGSGSAFNDTSSLMNPPSAEPLFSSELPATPLSIAVNMPQTSGPTDCENSIQKLPPLHQQLDSLDNHIFINGFDGLPMNPTKNGIINILPMSSTDQLQPNLQINNSMQTSCNSIGFMSSLNNLPTIIPPTNNAAVGIPNVVIKTENCSPLEFLVTSPKEDAMQSPINNMSGVQQPFSPYEIFPSIPLPKKISEKWIGRKMDKNKKIHVGTEYQAEIPNFRGNKGRNKTYRSMDEKLWDPAILDMCSYEEVDKYLEFACCSAVPGGGMNKEYALHLLTLSRGNIREALLRLMEKVPTLPLKLSSYSYVENQKWSSIEIMSFQIALAQSGKDFCKVSKSVVTKRHVECACFYYFWKKACPSEYQSTKQIWRDRTEQTQLPQCIQQEQEPQERHRPTKAQRRRQSQEKLRQTHLQRDSTTIDCNSIHNHVSFLVPAQDFRICK